MGKSVKNITPRQIDRVLLKPSDRLNLPVFLPDRTRTGSIRPVTSMPLNMQTFAEVIEGLRTQSGGSGQEKRRALRIEVESKVMVIPLRDGVATQQLEALTRDISSAGIGLLQCVAIAQGQQFVLRLPRRGFRPVVILCMSMYSRQPAQGVYIIGAEFVQVLSDAHASVLENAGERRQKQIQEMILS